MKIAPKLSPFTRASFKCILVADDLTGACDSGLQFARRGLTTRVSLGGGLPLSDVVAISTNSRQLDSYDAASSLREAMQGLVSSEDCIIFKKIDSTLRGHVIAECNALREGAQRSYGVIAPALPAQGRMVRNGWLEVNDISGAWKVDVRELLAAQGCPVGLAAPRKGLSATEFAKEIEQVAKPSGYVLCDAATEKELDFIAQALVASKSRPLWIGSAGLAKYAAASLSHRHPADLATTRILSTAPVVLVVGSQHPVTNSQLARLRNDCSPQVLDVLSASQGQVRSALEAGQHLVLRIDTQDADANQNRIRTLLEGISGCKLAAILLTGGDTAEMVCRAAQAEKLLLEGELLEGVATGVIEGGLFDGLTFATKSGGFGDDACLVESIKGLSKAITPGGM